MDTITIPATPGGIEEAAKKIFPKQEAKLFIDFLYYRERNVQIVEKCERLSKRMKKYKAIRKLASEYYMSEENVRRIIYENTTIIPAREKVMRLLSHSSRQHRKDISRLTQKTVNAVSIALSKLKKYNLVLQLGSGWWKSSFHAYGGLARYEPKISNTIALVELR